ncbi:unnamed protein product [Oncorhynchus mykiss]|uniref:Sideroflexin-1 n=1 Tax=Oncorhynchus mykiss TaxID=8022 RepID=A0A060Z190_ONCMY|nr:unnamed protein product [Oncorhynchus mykiss]
MFADPYVLLTLMCCLSFSLVFATPLCCALFPQKSSMSVSRLEPELQEKIRVSHPGVERVYFNKGL